MPFRNSRGRESAAAIETTPRMPAHPNTITLRCSKKSVSLICLFVQRGNSAAGTTQITTTLQVGNVTKTASMTVAVQVPPLAAFVGSSPTPQPSFAPAQVHLSAGGGVTWSLSGPEHSVTFMSAGSPASIPSLINASDSRSFPTTGTFSYVCDFHPTMTGAVYVH